MSDDLTVRILTDIRDEIRGTNERVDHLRTELRAEIRGTNVRVDATNERLDSLRTELRAEIGEVRDRLVESEIRSSTQFVALIAATRDVHGLLVDRFDLRDRVERVEQDVAEIKRTLKSGS